MIVEDKRNECQLVSFKEIKCGEMFSALIDNKECFYIKCGRENIYYGLAVTTGVIHLCDEETKVTPLDAKIVIEKARS